MKPPTRQSFAAARLVDTIRAFRKANARWPDNAELVKILAPFLPVEQKPDPKPDPKPEVPPPASSGGWDGVDKLDHHYGHVWARNGMATVASWAGEGWKPSGAMQRPSGASAGQGYGVYSVTLDPHDVKAPGLFACLWPADDVWRWEIDIVEKDFEGNAYSTIHWNGHTGNDEYYSMPIPGIDPSEKHTYTLTWAEGHLSLAVDGVHKWTTTRQVPKDFARGGVNACLGVGTQPAWAASYQRGDNTVDVLAASYRPLAA